MKSFHLPIKIWVSVCYSVVFLMSGNGLKAQITVSKTNALCGLNNGTASASVNHGTPPYTFKWSNGSSSASISNLAPGTYTVNVTDSKGCTGSKSVVVDVDKPELDVSISGGGQVPFCVQDGPPVITLTASVNGGNPPFIWAPSSSLSISGSGTYTFSVKDNAKCVGKNSVLVTYIPVRCSRDPNEIIGPEGYGDPRFISTQIPASYLINFENDPDFATAPAQKVVVTYAIDPHVSLSSIRLGEFGFGHFVFSVPPNTSNYTARLDVSDSLGVYLDVTAGINVGNQTVFWIFQSIDPATGLPPEDPMKGFLPINDSIHHLGEGYVTFSAKPKSTTVTGDSLQAGAVIVFDVNPPLATNTWLNIADALPPATQVDALPVNTDSTEVLVTCSGADDSGGSGIASWDLYVSENEGPFFKYASAPWNEGIWYAGRSCTGYSFFSIAKDHTGNVESIKSTGEAATTLEPQPGITLQPIDQQASVGDPLTFYLEAVRVAFYQWEVSADGGLSFHNVTEQAPFSGVTSNALLVSELMPEFNGMQFRCLLSNGGCFIYSDTVTLHVISSLSGTLTYDNAQHSPVSNAKIWLKTLQGAVQDSALTNTSGSYLFMDIEPGTYLVVPEVQKTWGGGNASDALLVLKHFTGLSTLTGLRKMAGDVNASGLVNAVDALLIARRFVGSVDGFLSGDWVIVPDTVVVDLNSQIVGFNTLCYGDVDGSYIPGLKTPAFVTLEPGATMNVQSGQQLTLPLVATKDMLTGAVSLVIHYPSDYLELTGMNMRRNGADDEVIYSLSGDLVRIAWYNISPLSVDQGDPLLFLHFQVYDRPLEGSLDIWAEASSEIADANGITLPGVRLLIPRLVSAEQASDYFLGQNYPNPCIQEAEILYFLPEEAEVDLSLYTVTGQWIKVLESGYQTAGFHKILFNASGLASGNYPYRLEIKNADNDLRLFHIMTVSR